MRITPIALMILVLLTLCLALPAQVQSSSSTTVSYTVQPGDTVYKIARQHCTTWYEVYHPNKHIIGPNPNVLKTGMVLTVPNRCDGDQPSPTPEPPDDNVYDRGPLPHARGPVYGDLYLVVYGDTMYSIARRFGLTVSQLSSANDISNPWRIYAGQRLAIPGLSTPKPTPTPSPPPSQPFITITAPVSGTVLSPTFTVSGTGGGLFEGNVVVRAINNLGQILAERPTTLQGPDVGTGGAGTWTVQLTVHVIAQTPGIIYAFSPGSTASDKVEVIFGVSGTGYVTFAPGQCRIQAKANAPLHASPNGPVTGQIGPDGGTFDALRGTISNGQRWYSIHPEADMGHPEQWLPIMSLVTLSPGCIW